MGVIYLSEFEFKDHLISTRLNLAHSSVFCWKCTKRFRKNNNIEDRTNYAGPLARLDEVSDFMYCVFFVFGHILRAVLQIIARYSWHGLLVVRGAIRGWPLLCRPVN